MQPKLVGSWRGKSGAVSAYRLNDDSTIVVKKILSGTEGGIDDHAIKEIHCLTLLKDCPYIIQLKSIDINKDSVVNLTLPYYQCNLREYYEQTPKNIRVLHFEVIFAQMVGALRYLYQVGILHCDIKPDNILIHGGVDCVLADFGAAMQLLPVASDKSTYSWTRAYSPGYRALEVICGFSYTSKADVWAMGVSMSEYLIGAPLFDSSEATIKVIASRIMQRSNLGCNYTQIIQELFHTNKLHAYLSLSCISDAINENHFRTLQQMLHINPSDRIQVKHITNSSLSIFQVRPVKLKRGLPLNMDPIRANAIPKWMVDTSVLLGHDLKTLVAGIDLVTRYLANYTVEGDDNIQMTASICSYIAHKLFEVTAATLVVWMEASRHYTNEQLCQHERLVHERLGHIGSTLEIEPLVQALISHKNPFKRLYKLIIKLTKEQVYFGSLSYHELASLLNSSAPHK